MSNKVFKRTFLSSALGLLLAFQGMQDASAVVYSYADVNLYRLDYSDTSGNVSLAFQLYSVDANAQANGVTDPGSAYSWFGGSGEEASVYSYSSPANSYSDAYSENDPYWDYAYASAATDSSLSVAPSGIASSDALLTYSFTATGSGTLELFAPLYYSVELGTGAGECGHVQSTAMIQVSMLDGGEVLDDSASTFTDSMSACGSTAYQTKYDSIEHAPLSSDPLFVSLDLEDGAMGYVTLYASALVEYFPEVVEELSLPASLGMFLLGLLMLPMGLRRKQHSNNWAS